MSAPEYTLENLVAIMSAGHVTRLKMGDGIELEMAPSGFTVKDAEAAAEVTQDENKACACGHSLMTEHNDHGCLHGCSIEVCAPQAQAEA